MAFEAVLEPNEHLVFQTSFQASRESQPFAFAVSNQALFLTAKQVFARRDPWLFQRVAHSEVLVSLGSL